MLVPKISTGLSTVDREQLDLGFTEAVILAAGRGTRMGRNKASLPWGDRTLLDSWIARFLAAGVHKIAVVLGPDLDLVRAASPETPAVHWVCNHQAAETGPRESLLLGIDALGAAGPLWFVPVDVPVVGATVLDQVRLGYRQRALDQADPPLAALPAYRGQTGHPVLAGPDLIRRLRDGEPGDRIDELLSWATRRLVIVEVDDLRVVGNMNRPQDYQAFVPPTGSAWDHCDDTSGAEIQSPSEDSESTDPGNATTLRVRRKD